MIPHDKEKLIRAYGYHFKWTSEHLTPEQMRPFMFSYDVLATECLDRFDEMLPPLQLRGGREKKTTTTTTANETTNTTSTPSPKESPEKGGQCPHPNFYGLLKQHAPSDPTLQRLWTEINTVPPWVDWDQIARGQKVFYRYAGPSIVTLTFHSLLGGMGSRRIVETLARTGGFGVRVARRRLLETFQHILDVTESLGSLQPGGAGFASTLRVRLLHASVRRRIMRLAEADPAYYDVSTLGIPISDLDSIGTVLTFSAAPIWVGFRRQGIFLSDEETADYVALWRYVAYLLGTPDHALSTPSLAKATMESLVLAEIDPTPTSQTLANNIIAGLQGQPPTYASADFLRAEAYWLNGEQLAAELAIPRPALYYKLLVAGQCLFFMGLCYVRRSVAAWDEAGIRRMRRLLRKATLDQTDGIEAMHEFQYIPRLGQVTGAGDDEGKEAEKKTRRGGFSSWETGSVERRNLLALLLASACAGWVAWLGARAAAGSGLVPVYWV